MSNEKDALKNFAKLLGVEDVFVQIEAKKAKEEKLLEDLKHTLGVKVEKPKVVEVVVAPAVVKAPVVIKQEVIVETPVAPMPELPVDTLVTQSVKSLYQGDPKDVQKEVDKIPDLMRREIDALKKSITDLHSFAKRQSQMGGGGEVNLRFLDDVDRSTIADGKYLNYNATTKKFQFSTVSGGGGGVGTLDEVTTLGNVTTNDITVGDITTDKVIVSTTAGATVTTGQIAWNTADLTFDMGMSNGVTLQVGQEQYIKVKAYEAISDGQAVMFAGASGEHILARKYDPTVNGFIPEWFIGVATQDLAHNAFGYITVFGKVHDVNTLAFSVGDILYADNSTPGALTSTAPTDPNPQIVVAAVTKRAGGDGHILVRPTFRNNINSLTDVTITTPSTDQVLKYDGAKWVNGTGQVNSDWNAVSGVAQILNKPSIPSLTGYATESYVSNTVASLVNSAPAALDTLNELATALGNDANFSNTVLTSLSNKANTSSLGTIASQNSNNVTVTGGTINGTSIGTTTAANGSFTTLIAGSGFANYIQLVGALTAGIPVISAQGTDENINLTLTPKGTGRVIASTGIKARVNSIAVAAGNTTLTWTSDTYDQYNLILSNTSAVTIGLDTGAPTDGQKVMFRINDDGTPRSIAWTTTGTNRFRVIATTLPTSTTTASKITYVGCIYNATASTWDVVAVGQEV
jgi:hypothetical protein